MTKEALKLALAVLKSNDTWGSSIREAKEKAITAIEETLTQPEQETEGKQFQTKFNLEDRVWYMKNNKPTEVIISAVEIFFVNTNQDQITYNAKDVNHSVSWLDHTKLQETWLFKSKTELLESL